MKIRNVAVVSTGTVAIRPQHVESDGKPLMWWLLTSRSWTNPRPINVYVIEHERGLILFDTGQDRRSITEPDYFPKGFVGHLYNRLARFEVRPDETLTERLGSLGYSPDQVHTVVLSHLHQDHIGGLPELTNANILVSADEWPSVNGAFAEMNGFLKRHIALPGLRWTPVAPAPVDDESISPFTAAYDIFGDGSLVLLPTPGHTPGSLSLFLRQEGLPPMLFVGDLTYDTKLLERERVPGVGRRAGLIASTRAVIALRTRYPDLVILAAHDPAAQGLLEQALLTERA